MFKKGQTVTASDGMTPWEEAIILDGPLQQLTSDLQMYIIQFTSDNDVYLVYEEDMKAV